MLVAIILVTLNSLSVSLNSDSLNYRIKNFLKSEYFATEYLFLTTCSPRQSRAMMINV